MGRPGRGWVMCVCVRVIKSNVKLPQPTETIRFSYTPRLLMRIHCKEYPNDMQVCMFWCDSHIQCHVWCRKIKIIKFLVEK